MFKNMIKVNIGFPGDIQETMSFPDVPRVGEEIEIQGHLYMIANVRYTYEEMAPSIYPTINIFVLPENRYRT